MLDPAPRDVPRLRATAGIKVIEGAENRIVFIGMDQSRDELLYSNIKGKNPFKDVRVRRAISMTWPCGMVTPFAGPVVPEV